MDYDLTGLGTREFEHLVQALCQRVFGAATESFGDGPDGGREATFEGPIQWVNADSAETVWDGYTVIQAKFRQRPRDPADNLAWLKRQIETELGYWTDSRYNRARHARRPRNLLVVTNVILSPAQGGGIDEVSRIIADASETHGLKLEGWRVWHYDQLGTLLDSHADIRRTFGGFITTGDVLGQLSEALRESERASTDALGQALQAHAIKELVGQQWIKLGEAGDPNDDRVSLSQVFVDLPAVIYGPRDASHDPNCVDTVSGAQFLIERGERVQSHGLHPDHPQHVLVVGGAGQGKSTLVQLACQVYRYALVKDAPTKGAEAERVMLALGDSLARLDMTLPNQRRWPVRIDLSEYGDAISGGEEISLLGFLAEKITRRSPTPVKAADLHTWLGRWPWFLVLDGLDEVATPSVREGITGAVSDFLIDAANREADVFIVVTTRPQGYAGEFGAQDFQRLELQPLERPKAIECARRLGEQRLHDDDDLREQVLQRMSDAAEEKESSRLLRTPLQVAIMQLLLERRQRAPHDRYQLFDAYFSAVYAREQNKPGWLGRLLEDHRADIEAIHEQLALRLQRQAERQVGREASVARSVLNEISQQRLIAQGFDAAESAELATKLMRAATHRLVLLVGVLDDDVTFEIRSLREYMAARAVTTGADSDVLSRLSKLVPSAHWRNTWLFAAGRLFVAREHLRASIITLLREADGETLLAMLAAPGAELATDLLNDDLAIRAPQYRRMLGEHAMERVCSLPDEGWLALATALFDAAESDQVIRARLDKQVDLARSAGGGSAATAKALLAKWSESTGGLAAHARQLTFGDSRLNFLDPLLARPEDPAVSPRVPLRNYLQPYLGEPMDADDQAGLTQLLDRLAENVRLVQRQPTAEATDPIATSVIAFKVPDMATLVAAFGRRAVADAFAELVDRLPARDFQVASALKGVARYWFARRPVAHLLE